MSEIDRPGSQSQQPHDGDENFYAPTAGPPAPASPVSATTPTPAEAFPAAPPAEAFPAAPSADAFRPAPSADAFRPAPSADAFPAAAAASAASPPPFSREAAAAAGTAPIWQTPVSATPATSVPVSGHGGEQTAWQQPVYATGGYPPIPPSGPPAWTPPASNGPRRIPTAVKVVVGGTAAVLLALCSGVTGAVVATAFNDNGGFSLPVSTDAAPVVSRDSLASVAQETQPSVVNIATGSGEGSGVILTADGFILSNNHVVESASGDSVTVTFSDGKRVKAKVVGTDPKTDLAVIKADANGLKAATLGDSNKVAVGDTVLAIGSPLGLQGSVTSGIISAKDRTIGVGSGSSRTGSLSGLLQTDAPINPGNSGGALVNMAGDVIGINTAIATSGGGEGNIGVGFAIPSIKAKQVAEQLIKGQKVSHPFLGVSVLPNDTGGAKIDSISPNSPAAAAGLKEGDVILKFGDRVINDSDDLVSAVQSGTVGDRVTVEFNRNGEKMTATVTLAEAS